MSTRYRLTITILLAALLGGVDAQAGVTVKGSVFGGGNQADVQVNTSVNISAGSVEGNVYGGGNLGDVGTHADQNPASTGNYVWKDQDGNAIDANTADNKMTGVCNVTISGGTIGLVSTDKPKEHGNVFGGGKGSATTFECEKGMVYNTNVSINTSASVKGNVYGGGEVSRVENNTDVTIGTASGEDVPIIEGSVFGAGAGINTHGYSALVRGTSTVTVQGSAQVKKNVYGGGELASVGRYKVKTPANEGDDDVPATLPYGMPARLIDGGESTVTIQDNAVIGTDGVTTTGHVYGAGQGLVPRLDYDYVTQEQFEGDDYIEDDHKPKRMISGNNWEYFATKSAYLQFVETLALSAETDVTITGSATVKGSVFGGSENGFVYHDTDVKIQDGSTVNGSAFGGGRGISSFAEAGRVKGNTGITISGGAVHGNVYGGGNLGDVGTINKSDANYNYVWKNSTVNGNINAEGNGNTAQNNDITGTNTNTGICTVTISGGTIGTGVSANADGTYSNGNVFGAGKGLDDTWWCEKAMVFATNVNITAGTVRGTVYGGGEIGRVEDDVKVTIGEGESAPAITGNVFGAGAGKHTHGYSALVRGNSLVTIKSNSTVGGSVYGGGEIASVGRFNVVGGLPKDPLSGGTCTVIIDDDAAITGDVFGACKGVNPSGIAQADRKSMQLLTNAPENTDLWSHYNNDENSLFIWRTYATDADYLAFLETLALTSNTEVTISGNATVNESVYGGGQRGITLGSVTVNMTGGTVVNDVYGGGALANTNKGNWDDSADNFIKVNGLTTGTTSVDRLYTKTGNTYTPASGIAVANTDYYSKGAWADNNATSSTYTTKVILTGGTVSRVFGGALGDDDNRAKVYGDILVVLNGTVANNGTITRIGNTKGCMVDYIFGANNLYGTPMGKVKVQVEATQSKVDENDAINKKTSVGDTPEGATNNSRYDVLAVYGGGNLSAYEPFDAFLEATAANKARIDAARTSVIINGCHYTSIKQVYGGGNAASVAAAHVQVNGTHEINEVFGGGNGNDPYTLDNLHYNNPGANVGYYNYTHWGSQTGTVDDPFEPIDNTDASTPEQRRTNYHYGSGIATTEIYGGLIHSVYGGSNQKGNISTTAISIYDNMDEYNCPVTVDETYGGGKNAPMDGEIQLNLDCVKNMPMIFGGAKNADINSDIVLNITNGSFDKVFGGNNQGGAIYGSITVNLEESGCQPIYINELYAGGYYAPYSIYGYEKDDQGNYSYSNGKLIPLESAIDNTQPDASRTPSSNPLINIISATKINNVFGGGYEATMVGSPHINVNMKAGKIVNVGNDYTAGDKTAKKPDNTDYTYTVTSIETDGDNKNAVLAIGSIGNIYGGGNLADVVGNTYVEIGTGQWINEDGKIETEDADGHKYTYEEKTSGTWKWYDENDQEVVTAPTPARNAATITGDVFGGGQGLADDETSAKVTGNSYINLANGSIAKSIYGGGEQAQIDGNTFITVNNGTIGTSGLGGATYGNIFGGGKGNTVNILSGLISGNSYVTVNGGTILHNIYGGGAYGSVGTYTYENDVITGRTANTGTANIWITGGTIGTDGKENGMVFGSSRGDVGAPDGIHDRLAWVYDTKVIIGDTTTTNVNTSTPLISGSVYGGGENGHNYNDAYVRINGGTIGIASGDDVTDPDDNTITYKAYNYPYRGNVYGGGCGTDMYDSNGDDVEDSYNPKAGIVLNNARVNITGGHIIRNVYGAGAMGSVGTITNDINEKDANDKYIYRHDQTKTESYRDPYSGTYQGAFYNFGLSWPVELVYPTTSGQDAHTYTGKTAVTITGSTTTIGVSNSDATGGDVYGAARGEAGDRFEMAGFANVREASVTIGTIGQDGPDIKGSVFGGSANGHVYEDASVVINSGTIAHSVYGGGNGNGTYKSTLWKPKSSDPDDITLHDETEIQDIYSFNAGKVYGNTNVTINGGTVKRNVYGGGNLGSVGKGNYSGGTDDYSTVGYGELPAKDNDQETALWTNSLFTNSGLATVIINSGTIGESGVNYDGLPTGNVFGSSRGKAALNVGQRSPRYKYVPDFFLGYTNETTVIIGSDDENYSGTNPIIYGSVYGGGQDGHVRRGTNVTVNKGTIGMASEGGLDRGNVFGAGSGIGTYTDVYDNNTTKCSNSSGSVTSTTTVDIKGGTIYQNVYGGGALASVGPPWAGQGAPLNSYDERKEATETSASYSYTQVNIKGGNISGSVYGASRGPSQSLIEDVFTVNDINTYDAKSFATVIWADVNVTGNAGIAGSVFGGGEKGIVKHATEVNIGTTGNNGTYTGTISQNVYGGGKEAIVGGNVTVNINSGTITHNVYGGGDQANTNTNSVKINNVNETGAYNTADEPANGVSTVVTMSGASAQAATVYGGGNLADVIGNVTVNIEDGTLTGSSIGSVTGAVFGGGFGETTKVTGNVEVNIGTRTETITHNDLTDEDEINITYSGDADITGDVYGGSAKGKVNTSDGTNATGNTTTSVNLYGGSITGNIYGGGLGDNTPSAEIAANVYGPVTVTVEGGSATNVYGCNNLYGAPQNTVAVNINGTATPTPPATYAIGNVYGGGNLAAYGGSPTVSMSGGYVSNIFGGGNLADVAGSVTVTVSGGNVINDVYGGGALANTNTANWNDGSGSWADGKNDNSTGTTYKTTLNLTGGTVGNAYGGGLGQQGETPVDATVYGDVTIEVNGTAFTKETTTVSGKSIPTTGRVFGANNLQGSPKGNVTVNVRQTQPASGTTPNKTSSSFDYTLPEWFDLIAVYGGGNQAHYVPASGKKTQVNIYGCEETSIMQVYGSGNSADVPESDVIIWGSYVIGTVFGGGNGSEPGSPGANVSGTAKVTLKGGEIYDVFGGSNTKGTCGNAVIDDKNTEGGQCLLKIRNIYGAGKSADVTGNVTVDITGCNSSEGVNVYAGSYDAMITGGVTLNITGGILDNVFAGNNQGGSIGGPIVVNIEETDDCKPVIINNLYGGGNNAAYPGEGAKTYNGGNLPIDQETSYTQYTDGEITVNVRSCTYIGNIYGGGKGELAQVNGNTEVNINLTKGYWATKADNNYRTSVFSYESIGITGNDATQIKSEIEAKIPNIQASDINTVSKTFTATILDKIGTIDSVFGGGNKGKVNGDAVVNIGTAEKTYYVKEPVQFRESPSTPLTPVASGTYQGRYEATVAGANITANVYGGGKEADVTGNTFVNICTTKSGNDYIAVAQGSSGVSIGGDVYGGGQGVADNFYCDKAMVGVNNAGVDTEHYPNGYPDGRTHISIGNGTVNGSVYGGGQIGRVEMNTTVLIGFGNGTTDASKPEIKGNVFGGGKGVETHGYSALVRGNPTVIIEGKAKVRGSVYGGGEIASVARYNVKTDPNDPNAPTGWPMNMPYALKDANSGFCTVTIQGYAEIGPDAPMKMTATDGPDDLGHVFGAGKGIMPKEYTYADDAHKPKRMVLNNDKTASIWEYFSNEANYIQFIETLALASETEVEIKGNAFVKGSVYGGSENGIVQYNTHVTIDGDCQIGAGENINRRYTADEWSSESLAECAHWDYAAPYAPYDLYNDSNNDGKPDAATDGHTFYGNVFGGGSGYYPYRRKSAALDGAAWVKDNDKSTELGRPVDVNGYSDGVWLNSAGIVRGNTVVDIKGGHVLTSIYGGNEQTDVQGSCTINMSGGTLGVPRTLQQIALHPVTCYLFGAGKGDPRVNFNTWTNVASVDVNITGGKIYGSVFGGGEDGHVLGDVTVDISNGAKIGTTGTSYVDGNVFGGGRGFSGDAQTAGSVGGNIDVTITGGEMLGSIYGGGRLASVGTQFANPESPDYGNFVEDNVTVYYSQAECDQLNAAIPGFIPAGAELTAAQVEAYNAENPGAPKTEGATLSESEANEYNSKLPGYLTTESVKTPATRHGHVKIDISGGTIGNENATGDGAVHSGNVFGGSMGRLDLLNGTRNPIWPKLAQVKSTAVNISGNAEIIRSVYGGGEFGTVRDNAYVTIGGTRNNDGTITKSGSPTIYRDVYGGGYGSDDKSYTIITVKEPNTANPTQLSDYITNRYAFSPMQFAGCVGQSTTVNICGGYIWKSVYGGGEMASVGIFNSLVQDVTTEPGDDKVIVEQEGNTKWTIYSNIIKHYDDESTFALSWPYKFEYLDAFPGTTQINITGGRIGAKEGSDANSLIANNEDFGDVYGGGKGIAGDYNDYIFCANVGSTEITIDYTDDENKVTDPSSDATSTGNYITGAVYGGAENGHVMGDTKITLTNGLIGHALYGGGSGKGTYETSLLMIGKTKENANPEDYYTRKIYSITAGKVFGNTEINMKGGYVVRNVYGGGTYGSVGKGNYAGGTDDYSYYYNDADNTQYNGYGEAIKNKLWSDENEFSQAFLHSGICTVNITGGTVGYIKDVNSVKDGLPYGNVFGGCRGESAPNITEKPRYQYTPESFMGYANQTIVTIGTKDQSSENAGQPGKAPRIYGSVYGGGQDGHVRRDATVTIYSGEIGSAYDNTKFNDDIWLHSGNVYGAGSGIGKYKYDFNYDDDYDDNGQDDDHTVRYHGNKIKEEDYSTSAGSVTRYTKVEIQGGKIHRNVYGGGSLASIGAPKYPIERTDGDPESHNEVIISGGQIGSEYSYDAKGNHIYGGNVYGASRGQEGLGVRFSSSVQTNVTISGGLIKGDVYGGGEIGAVKCDVDVNLLGGTIEHSIYGGGALANTNTSNWNPATDNFADGMVTTSGKITTTYNTKLNLLGGVIGGEAYGGGLGQLENSQHNQSAVEAFVYGDVILNLNGLDKNDYSDNTIPSSLMSLMSGKVTQIPNSTHEYRVSTTGAIVDQIFGANNLNGTPKGHIKVHVFATQNKNALKPTISDKFVRDEKADSNPTLFNHLADSIIIAKQLTPSAVTSAMEALNADSDADDIKTALAALKTSIDNYVSNSADATIAQNKIDSIRYDVKAVYGGGNLAAYIYGNGDEKIENTDANKAKIEAARTEVIIDGCDYTSIKTVYGGGNAASASGTYVEVNSTYEINEVFGGGNGADSYYLIEGDKAVWYENPGANVGYKNYTHVVKDGSKGDGSKDNPYQAIDNTGADTPENRRSNYGYGSGIASTDIRGGTIHYVFGGSNKKGNISTTALSVYSESDDDCRIDIHETYGGGKDAPIDGDIVLTLDCVKDMDMIFGGSKNADVNSNITLNITNGRFNKVFGGNNTSGAINGSITVNIEEKGCVPIDINELYGGGYLAPYSIYGYEKDADGNYNVESVPYIDNNTVNYLDQRIPLTSGDTHNNDPRINIISATRIGTVYGGGYQAKVVGSPYVNVNMTNGKVEVKNTADSGDPVYKDGHDTIYTNVTQDTDNGKYYATLAVGTIDTIFGGGNLADIVGDTHVEIGTGRWVTSWDANGNPIYETVDDNGDKYYYKVETAAVTYGSDECTQQNAALPGAITTSTVLTTEQATRLNELLSLSGDDAYTENGSPTQEHAEAYNATLDGYITTADVKTPAAWAWYGSDDNKLDDQTQPTPARYAANIRGDVFGGGKGKADNFTCDKAMIGIENEAADPAKRNGGTNVIIANGTVGGSVYGGGMIGRVEKNTAVTIGFESGTGEPVIEKDVFGAGMGIDTHGYAGLVRGNSSVIIQGKSKVRGSVYGGGMQASLGRYFIATIPDLATAHNVEPGMPYDLKSGGKATVTVQGSAEIGPDDMLMTAAGGPRYTGHVFGAGKGTVPYSTDNPGRYTMSGWESYSGDDKEAAYIKYIETLGITNETEVTVGDSAFIKGSVYGGGENGFVLKNTHVTIQDNCQIGNGLVQMADDGTYLTNPLSMNRPYSKEEWTKGKLIMTAADRQELRTLVGNSNYTSSLPECSSWPYQAPYAPYDKFADADGNYPSGSAESTARGGRSTGSDGHTFYGNVFGGGSGYYPYKPGKWHDRAGSVGGNTVVEITGGHILTSVYGGNELTNVDGSATVTMKGGTLGVPRTLGQIAAHPITCYLFGAGKGDMRTFFNTENNVASALVTVSDSARIFGSVFGGGEDGHVLGDVTLNISDTAKIGTTGTSYVDGNVFGAGRGFNGEAITAGSVGGNIEVNISGGTMLGSVYGGGRLASVGIGFNAVTDADYGQFTNDTDSRTYGHITVNISGGTIGNDLENQFFAVDVDTNGKTAQEVETAKNNGLKALKDAYKIPNTDFELYDSLLVGESTTLYKYLYRTVHTKGGNVYGGSMGRLTLLDNSFNPVWPQLGQAKSTTVNITGGTIKSNVYGGGEIGSVRDNTYVTIGGNRNADGTVTALGSPTIYRDVYGGGYGSTIDSEDSKAVVESTIEFGYTPLQWAGIVGIGTEVNIYGGWVKKSVYGGGEMASVGIINYVLDDETEYATEADVPAGKVIFRKNPATQNYTVYANIVKHTDESNSFALSWPYEFEYIPQYTGTAKVNIRGGRIGITGKDFMGPFDSDGNPLDITNNNSVLDKDTEPDKTKYKNARMDNGDVFGGGKGMAGDRYDMAFLSNVGSSEVTIDYPAGNEATPQNYKKNVNGTYTYDCITGSVYAGAENGHVMGNTQLTLNNGLIGHAIYGGGKGKGTYTQKIVKIGSSDYTNVSIYSITAGKVYGNTKVDMTGGYVVRNVYGGGNMGSVGKGNYAGGIDDYSSTGYGEALNGNLWDGESLNSQAFLNSGKTEVTITGGTIGYIKPDDAEDSMKDGLPYGNVFGGCRGESAPNIRESPRYHYSPQFYSGYTNETKVTIGTESGTAGPTILGSVYGGGQDGHVRRDASVTIYSGEIGRTYSADALNITDPENPVWLHRGNVYGAGSGIGKYQYDFNYDGDFDDDDATYNNKSIKEQDYSTSAGSVTRFTNVEINGGKIHRNVYGGGSLASVGAPKIPPTRPDVPYIKGDTVTGHSVGRQSLSEVIINGGTIGDTNSRTVGYGGNVYGASRGLTELGSGFATSVWTKVEANSGHIYGNVFGGGEAGSVTMDSKVIIGGKVENTNSGSGAPRRTTPAVQPDAAAPANTNSSSNSSTVTPANVATEAPDARSIRINRAQ